MGRTGPTSRSIIEIFKVLYENSNEENGCWIWQGYTVAGYGSICFDGKAMYIHRFVCEKISGEVTNVVRHSCDNKLCWNPKHLLNGSHWDNVKDKVSKLRHGFGEKHYKAIVSMSIVRDIRHNGLTYRQAMDKYNLTKGCAHNIVTGRTWKHVT